MRVPAALCAVLLFTAAAPTPEADWKAGIADENRDYAQIPHAMLKIQDSVYLGEGARAVLTGRKGVPASWHWSLDARAQGRLAISFAKGRLSILEDGKNIDPAQVTKSIAVDKDVDIAGQPTQVQAGVNGWRIFVYNQQNPVAKNFKGVSYYPYDPAFRVEAAFHPDRALPAKIFRTSRGTGKQFYHAGDAVFSLKGRTVTLPFYTDSNRAAEIKDMSAFYTDELTGKGAYSAGRYVDVDGWRTFPPAKITIDFNMAYNPNCARSAHFTCPLAVDEIPVAMAAGERDPHQMH
jgi:uncharacterized protein (DUF1684 family)